MWLGHRQYWLCQGIFWLAIAGPELGTLLECEGNYTRLHLASGRPLIPRSLRAVEERLPAHLFFRANCARIINVIIVWRRGRAW